MSLSVENKHSDRVKRTKHIYSNNRGGYEKEKDKKKDIDKQTKNEEKNWQTYKTKRED